MVLGIKYNNLWQHYRSVDLFVNSYLLLVSVLQQLHVTAALTVGPAQGGTAMLRQQVGWRRHTAPLRIHPGVDVIGDITAWYPAHRTHRHAELFAAFQHLWQREKRAAISPACLLSDKRLRQLCECQYIHAKKLTFPLHMIKSSVTHGCTQTHMVST